MRCTDSAAAESGAGRSGSAPSLDFGKKAYGNLVELARLQEHVAGRLDSPVGRLIAHAKSAHLYEPEWELTTRLTARRASLSSAGP